MDRESLQLVGLTPEEFKREFPDETNWLVWKDNIIYFVINKYTDLLDQFIASF